jgi:hypothetical protein
MTLPLRRALALLFACFFILVAIGSVAYGRGYRIDTKTRHIRLTGVILLAGAPNHVRVSIDDGETKNASLPTTFRGLFPTTHTVTISAPGYISQVFTMNVRSGQTTFATDLELYRTAPFSTLRTGIPSTAVLAPDGSTVAWIENGTTLAIADPTNVKKLPLIPKADHLAWSSSADDILLLDEGERVVGVVSREGAVRGATYAVPDNDRKEITKLLNSRMVYQDAQRIPGSTGWLLKDDSSAWVLLQDGSLTLATRWGNSIINTVHMGRESLATVRREEILVRNVANAQTARYELPNITQATAGVRVGEINLLLADGDLLQWTRGNVFSS